MYVYRLSTGEFEMLSLSEDQTFVHKLYPNAVAFDLGGEPGFEEESKWSLLRDSIELSMSSIFDCDMPARDMRLPQPRRTRYGGFGAGLG